MFTRHVRSDYYKWFIPSSPALIFLKLIHICTKSFLKLRTNSISHLPHQHDK